MKTTACRSSGAAIAIALLLAASVSARRAERPNIVFFLVDDLSWMGSAVYGSEYYETPNIDRLASSGMLFTEAWAASPVCSPTRASILTGRHPARLGLTNAVGSRLPQRRNAARYTKSADARYKTIQPDSLRYLSPKETTIAEVLRNGGYVTAHIGKWHLGRTPEYWPDQQGFQKVVHGVPDSGPKSYLSPYGFLGGNLLDGPPGEYITDRLTDEALEFIEENRERAFFLNLWHYAVHGPWGHKQEITKRFLGREDPRGEQTNPIMASMIKSVDESMGRILDKLDELGLRDKTVVIFFSDNGGDESSRIGPDRLAPTSNAPLRAAKGWLYEGGIRVPLIISWPRVVARGSRSDQPVSSVDLLPTMLDLVGRKPLKRVIDGVSLGPVLRRTGGLEREAIFAFYPHGGGAKPPGVAVRSGDWKLIRWFETNNIFFEELELYNLREDLSETTNLIRREPEIAQRLDSLIDRFLDDTGALVPRSNPAYDPVRGALAGLQVAGRLIEIADGRLRLGASEQEQFLRLGGTESRQRETPRDNYRGPLTLAMRLRSERPGTGRVQWLHSAQAQDYRKQVAEFAIPTAAQWTEIEVRLDLGPSLHLRDLEIYLPSGAGEVDIDWIRIHGDGGADAGEAQPLWAWEFELPREQGSREAVR